MFTFLHAADLHLDSPLVGLDRYEGAPVHRLRGATRSALENLVDRAIEEEVAFVLLAGDLYDGDWRDFNTGLFLAKEMTRLRRAGIRVLAVSGNHDAASQISRTLSLPDNVVTFPTRAPATELLEEVRVAVHGQGFPRRQVPEDLSAAYPPAVPGYFNVGLLHTSATGRPGHEVYAPCTVEGLRAKGYDYWALGHVHRREVVSREPWIVFAGNLQGRNIRETGPKGCTRVTVEGGRVASVEEVELDVLRWDRLVVDASGAETAEEVMGRVRAGLEEAAAGSAGRLLALRLAVEGPCRAHRELVAAPERWVNEIRMAATDASWGSLWVEKVGLATRPPGDLSAALERPDALGDLLRYLRDLSPDEVSELTAEFAPLEAKLPHGLLTGEEAADWRSPEGFARVLEEVKHLLLARLLEAGEGP